MARQAGRAVSDRDDEGPPDAAWQALGSRRRSARFGGVGSRRPTPRPGVAEGALGASGAAGRKPVPGLRQASLCTGKGPGALASPAAVQTRPAPGPLPPVDIAHTRPPYRRRLGGAKPWAIEVTFVPDADRGATGPAA